MSSTTTTTTQSTTINTVASQPSPPTGQHTADIIFFQDPADGATPFNYVSTAPEGQPQNNFGAETHNVTVNDIRSQQTAFTLDTSGFQAVSSVPSELKYDDWDSDETIQKVYYPETEQFLLKHVPGAKRVLLFDHTIRRTKEGATRAPVTRAHIDQTDKSGAQRVYHHLPEEANQLVKDRVRIINVWRPLSGPVRQFPLAMADSRSVQQNDLVAVEHRYPDRTGETAGVRHSEGQQWWYLSGMQEDERILLQCYDSDGSRARVAHTAIVDSRVPLEVGRESIEVRALVFG